MNSKKDTSKNGLKNLVLVVCAGYLATTGLVGHALLKQETRAGITASTPDTASVAADPIGGLKPSTQRAMPVRAKASTDTLPDSALPTAHKESTSTGPDRARKPAKAGLVGGKQGKGESQTNRFEPRYDQNVLEAARERAAEKIGDLRGSVTEHDISRLNRVTRRVPAPSKVRPAPRHPRQQKKKNPVVIQRPSWQPGGNSGGVLPPIVQNDMEKALDQTMTSSTGKERSALVLQMQDLELRR